MYEGALDEPEFARTNYPATILDPVRIRAFMATRGFAACDGARDIAEFHALADSLIPVEIASAETIAAIHNIGGASAFLLREDGAPTGFLAFFAFSQAGERAVADGKFHGVRVEPQWVSEPSPQTKTGYVWGFGGKTKRACFAVIKTGRIIRDQFFPHLGVYARAATPDGRKVMEPLGYSVVSNMDPGFYYSPPFSLASMADAR